MAFKADRVVNALEFDFRPHVEAFGITPEPSDRLVEDFQFTMREVTKPYIKGEEDLDDITADEYRSIQEEILDAIGALTQGVPSREEIEALPFRIQRAYVAWMQKELTDPEEFSDATKPSRAALRSVGRTS